MGIRWILGTMLAFFSVAFLVAFGVFAGEKNTHKNLACCLDEALSFVSFLETGTVFQVLNSNVCRGESAIEKWFIRLHICMARSLVWDWNDHLTIYLCFCGYPKRKDHHNHFQSFSMLGDVALASMAQACIICCCDCFRASNQCYGPSPGHLKC